jgi:hypothetical protein
MYFFSILITNLFTMKKILIAIILAVLQSKNLNAQNDLLNLKKYWYYHYRVLNDFMAKGDCQGCSEVMGERAYKGSTDTDPTPSVRALWGDNIINLGHYIAVLATEYKLLKDRQQLTDTTLQELYYAIKAFNRLDKLAEVNIVDATHTIPQSGDLNGFFIRDDVPQTFLSGHPKLLNGVTSSRPLTGGLDSDFTNTDPTAKEMSQDQIWYLFTGFSLVSKYVDADVTYKGKELNDVNYNPYIQQEVRDITDRIINRLKTHSWEVRNPNNNVKVARGYQVGELSYGAAEAACFIKNPTLPPSVYAFPVVHTCNSSHDFISFASATVWMNIGYGIGGLYMLSTEDYKPQQIVAVGNSWYTSAIPVVPNPITIVKKIFNINNILHPWKFITELVQYPPIYPDNVTAAELGVRALYRNTEHLPLLRQVLHEGPNLVPASTYENMLNTAPCEGPRCYWSSGGECSLSSPRNDWSSSDRLHNSEERIGASNPHGSSFQGEYNGLDYMLYYNLYHIINPGSVPYTNYMDRVITISYPTTSAPIVGTNATPVVIEAFNSITASNTVNNNANVTYRAGNEVVLLPGFVAKSGSNFRSYIAPFHCATDGSTYESPTHNDNPYGLGASSSQSAATDLLAYTGPTSFVSYPKNSIVNGYSNANDPVNIGSTTQNTNPSSSIKMQNPPVVSQTVSGILINPNPNNGIFQIMVTRNNQSIGIKELKVYDLMGREIWSTGSSENTVFTIDISSYSPGVYYVRSINELGETEMKKLIKQ